MLNLVGNAMKFTFKGYIKIIAESVWIKNKQCVMLAVEDTGIGIKKEDLNKLFKLFSRIDKTSSLNKSGIGLGLMISYKYSVFLTFKNGKGIQVKSKPGVGTTFYFYLENKW